MSDRHARQQALAGFGPEGQALIRGAKILIVGLGGLGSPAALYLAGAGVGVLGLCDFDTVDLTNLHRQPLYSLADVGEAKVKAAEARLRSLDPKPRLVPLSGRADATNAAGLVRAWDIVLDCTDDMEARYALSDACVAARIPLVHGAVSQWEGECTVFAAPGPCYRCLYPAPPTTPAPTCATEGVLGTVPGLIGTLQAQEALKLVLGSGNPLIGRMVLFDGLDGSARTISLNRREGCLCTMVNACPLPWAAPAVTSLSVEEYLDRKDGIFLLDVREPDEFEEIHMPDSKLIPLGELQERHAELPKDRPIACVCASGGRSAHAAVFLRKQGYDALNLRGGIRAWMSRL